MQGYFCVHKNEQEKFDIVCELHPKFKDVEIPEESQNLYVEIEAACNIIKSLNDTTEKKRSIF